MTRNIAFLRGVNVGGRNRLPMKELAGVLGDAGCSNVRTYIQSGNVVFDGDASADEISAAIEKNFGFRPAVIKLSAKALAEAHAACPYKRQAKQDPKSVHVYFLASPPADTAVAALEAEASTSEAFTLDDAILYLFSSSGLSASNIAKKADRLLKVDNTARNWNTICAMMALAEEKS